MNIAHVATLIRVLFVLVMLGLMVIAGALMARRRSSRGPGVVQRSQRFPAVRGSLESNDSEVAEPYAPRRAA
jgi:hypothetical protein